MLITYGRFLSYQEAFYRKVIQSPLSVQVITITTTSQSDIDDFLGSGNTAEVSKAFPVLYNTQMQNMERETGLNYGQDADIYLSPRQLISEYGSHIINPATTKILKSGHLFIIRHIEYLEPFFNTCIAIAIYLEDAKRQ